MTSHEFQRLLSRNVLSSGILVVEPIHFPLNVQGAVVRLASGQIHHMLVRLLLISRLLVQALTHLWVHSLAHSQIFPSSRRIDASVGWSTDSHAVSSVGPAD
jgi:hypothetical protein